MSGQPGGELFTEIVATSIPAEVADPHGSNSFALKDGVATKDPDYAKRVSVDVTAQRDNSVNELFPPPTEEETTTLRKVADSIPKVAYTLCFVELGERASYFGVQTVFSNFMQFPLPRGGNGAGAPPAGTQETAGALGKGLQFANAMVLLFAFLSYLVPIFGGWIADTKLGRFRTIFIGVLICVLAHIIMICSAIPSLLQAGNAIAPFMISLFLLAFGAGVFKPNIAPTLIDQYQHQKVYTKVLPSGEKVLVDPETTVQRIFLLFYAMINIGAFFAIATTFSEKIVGYWLAFLTPGAIFMFFPFLLWYLNNKIVKYPPDGSALTKAWKISTLAIKRNKGKLFKKGFWNAAKPSVLAEAGITTHMGQRISWTDKDVEDIRRTLEACMIFMYYPIYNLNDGGIGSVATSQGSTMTTNGAPNDLLNNFNPLTIIFFVPLLSHVIYPALAKRNIKFGRISRMTLGFVIATISGVIGAIVQWRIYKTSPCGFHATGCTVGTGVSPLSIWWQIPNVSLGAISETLTVVTYYELAYARSPPGMKALVMSLFLFTNALSSAVGEIVTPAIKDPNLIWIWAAPAIALALQTVVFWFRYKHLNDDEFMTYEDPLIEKTPEAEVESLEAGRTTSTEKV